MGGAYVQDTLPSFVDLLWKYLQTYSEVFTAYLSCDQTDIQDQTTTNVLFVNHTQTHLRPNFTPLVPKMFILMSE